MFVKILITVVTVAGINGILSVLLIAAERFFSNYGECTITINNEKEIKVTGGASLLVSLNNQKIFLPSACGGRGTCAYCKCKIIKGGGALLPTEEPLISKEEAEDQIRLACQVKVRQDLRIEIPDELFKIHEFEAEVALIKDLTYDIKLLRLNLIDPGEINFKAGQYVQLQSKLYDKVKEGVYRAYSIASPDFENKSIDLMIRLIPEGICTSWVFFHLNEKERIKFTGPMGDFRLHDGVGEIIMVAGGSGMAPMVSLLSEISEKKIGRRVTYFFGAITKKDLFYLEEMKRFEEKIADFTFIPALSQPEEHDEWRGQKGLITAPLENYLKKIDNSEVQVYLCGSPGMINACIKVVNKYGIRNECIFYDPFA